MGLSAAAYLRMLWRLMPPGSIWGDRDATSNTSRVLEVIGLELARVDARGDALLTESDPRTATETLSAWESALGLPDTDVSTVPETVDARRAAITQKLVGQGGQRVDYYVQVAAACGYVVTVDDGYGARVALVGRARCGDRLYGSDWAYVMRFTVQPPADPSAVLTHAELERVLTRRAPSHVVLQFVYL